MKTVEFLVDVVSPNAYLTWRVLPGLAERCGAKLKMTPVLLGGIFKATGNRPPMMAFGEVRGKLAYENLEIQRFVARHALDKFAWNPAFPLNSLTMMRGAFAAEERGELTAYLDACFAGMWEDGERMDDPETLVRVLNSAGLDGQTLVDAAQDRTYKQALKASTDNAAERGAFGVPTFFVGEEMFFGKERLGQVEEALA